MNIQDTQYPDAYCSELPTLPIAEAYTFAPWFTQGLQNYKNSNLHVKQNNFEYISRLFLLALERMQQPMPEAKKVKPKSNSLYTTHATPKPKAQAADSIKTVEEVSLILDYFLSRKQYRNYALFVTGICSAYRISDLLSLKYSDFYNMDGSFKYELDLSEKKTGNRRKMEITKPMQQAISLYIEQSGIDFEYDSPIFRSSKYKNEAIKKEAVHKIFKDAGRELKLPYNIGSHTMRKTYGYWYLQIHKNDMTALSTLQNIFGHSSEEITLKYCEIKKEEIRENNRDVSRLWGDIMNKGMN